MATAFSRPFAFVRERRSSVAASLHRLYEYIGLWNLLRSSGVSGGDWQDFKMAKLTFLKETLDAKRREQGSYERCALLYFLEFASELGSIRPRLAGLQNGKVNLSERDFRCQKTGTRVLRKMCLARFLAARFPIRRPVLLHD